MISIENTRVDGWEAAIRGMRNPMNSWGKSDSLFVSGDEWHDICGNSGPCPGAEKDFDLGQADLKLMKKLVAGGHPSHCKFRRMITVSCDILAPLYWWKEFDTYKVGTVANSCSTMHKLHENELTINDFSYEYLSLASEAQLKGTIHLINQYRYIYNNWGKIGNELRRAFGVTSRDEAWLNMIQLLPSSYNQRRTVMLNYEVLSDIYLSRKSHKLEEWRDLCIWIQMELPYSEIIIGETHTIKEAGRYAGQSAAYGGLLPAT